MSDQPAAPMRRRDLLRLIGSLAGSSVMYQAMGTLGLNAESFPNPWRSMLSASVSTAIGGFIPIIPFFFTVGMPAVIASFVISTLAHFVVGASKSLVTTRSWWASGAEMTVVGVIEAAITYGLGVAFAGH